ncbi:uncharacterized protein LOC125670955 isoform X3 [Ostrea edulis]|uniref:uncharacterized protein LOC125670955 isoform X3 n=1 Tax=Ostrea edulis TaxID=37623 RepID=UPI0024AF7CA1|nr:uncharacterized protein LOC125670955 isoform X3 [Ostrea edulis]
MGAIRMLYIVGLLFVGNIAFAAVVLDVKNTTVEYSQTDIDIRCLVNETSLSTSRFFTIQLKKSSNNVVSFAKDDGISWQDFTMQNRSGVSVNASMSSTTSAYLYLAITKDGVKYPDDMGSYQCDYSYFKPTSGLVMISSEIVFVNITGFEEMTTAEPTSSAEGKNHEPVCLVTVFINFYHWYQDVYFLRSSCQQFNDGGCVRKTRFVNAFDAYKRR